MEYPYRTEITWEFTQGSDYILVQLMDDEAALRAAQNKTDGILTFNGAARVRNWASLEDAQSWVAWGQSLQGINVINAEIISNSQ